MDEKPEHTDVAREGDRPAAGSAHPRALAEVIPFPDLIGERREASCLVIRDELGNIPDFRMEKIRDAQEKIRSGFYERADVLERVIGRLLADTRGPALRR